MKRNIKILGNLATIKLGHPFRGAVEHDPQGATAVIQVKNVTESLDVDWDQLARTDLKGRREPDWLQTGDILFAARGHRNTAVHLGRIPIPTVCAPHFFHIRVKDAASLRPDYLAWYINQAPAQHYLASAAEGTMVRSIRRAVLEALPIPLPPVARQATIVELETRIRQEQQLLQRQLENSRAMMTAIARDLIQPA